MVHFLFRHEQAGNHVHVDVFAGTEQQAAERRRAWLGRLIMDPEQWEAFQSVVGMPVIPASVEFKPWTRRLALGDED